MVLAETSDVAPGNTIMRASSMRATNLSENGLASCMKSIGAFLIHRGQGRWIRHGAMARMGEFVKGLVRGMPPQAAIFSSHIALTANLGY
jgi:hypothetical protein